MRLTDIPFCTVNWSELTPTEHPGVTGKALWRTFEMGNIRVRMVENTHLVIWRTIGAKKAMFYWCLRVNWSPN